MPSAHFTLIVSDSFLGNLYNIVSYFFPNVSGQAEEGLAGGGYGVGEIG
jgi:hypothetical protein